MASYVDVNPPKPAIIEFVRGPWCGDRIGGDLLPPTARLSAGRLCIDVIGERGRPIGTYRDENRATAGGYRSFLFSGA